MSVSHPPRLPKGCWGGDLFVAHEIRLKFVCSDGDKKNVLTRQSLR